MAMKTSGITGRRVLAAGVAWVALTMGLAAELAQIPLPAPDKKRGLPFMETLAVRASATEYAERELSRQDLADLLWAACGVNRPESGKITAPSAMNSQDIDVYVLLREGAFRYEAAGHRLIPVVAGDLRGQIMMARPPRPAGAPAGGPTPPMPGVAGAPGAPGAPAAPPPPGGTGMTRVPPPPQNPPVQLLLVSETARFRFGTPELKAEWAAYDAGIVSQNISLFCAATGLRTRPRAALDKQRTHTLLSLKESQLVLLNHPVGYAK